MSHQGQDNAQIIPLGQVGLQEKAVIFTVDDLEKSDPISRRLRELGFVEGESVKLMSRAPFGGDPIMVQIGFGKFALRLGEANRIKVTVHR
ncbi:MAG: FeoA family protein [Alphaproteobacteria bacterium]|nr:FeoA family protein [Alphaproteobacteria bacterium]